MINKLIKQYFNKNSSDKEKEQIFKYLTRTPSAFLNHFSAEEWNTFIEGNENLPEYEDEMNEDFQQAFTPKKSAWAILYKTISYAAIFTVILFLAALWLKNDINKKPQTAEHSVTSPSKLIANINTSSHPETIVLPDSSIVDLSAGSKISYLQNLEPGKRDITLEGSAIFKVSKDAKRPFTVFCKEVATTALGTIFKVNNSVNGKIDVELLEGKIVVRRSADSNNNNERYYLLAGNAITFDRLKNKFTEIYNLFEESKPPYIAKGKSVSDSAETSVKMVVRRIETPQSIQFNDEALANVFDYMADTYGVKIIYPTTFISRIHFIGTVHKSETIEEILRNITSMNDLMLTHDSSTNIYIIRVPDDSNKQK